jgi:16S rRNA G966 N2-methylase RsmD
MKLSELKPDPRNANKGTERGRNAVKESLVSLGAGRSIVIDRNGVILAGNKTAEAAKSAGISEDAVVIQTDGSKLVVVQRTDLDANDPKAKALALADNRTAELGLEWNTDVLKELSSEIDLAPYFSASELSELLPSDSEQIEKDENTPTLPDGLPVTRENDVWQLGRHRLICADGTDAANLAILLRDEPVQMVYTDPPYGVEIVQGNRVSTGLPPGPALRGKVGADKPFGKVGNIHNGMKMKPIIEANTYAPIIGDDSTDTAIRAFQVCSTLTPKPVMIFWGGNYYASALPDSSCWVVWDKDNGESFFADAELAWTNQKTAVRIFKHTWNGLIKASERGEKRCHPTQKPVALAEWCFEKYGATGDKVLDLFGGSGSTLIACEKLNRVCYMSELSPHYVDVIINRWQTYSGNVATLESDGRTFEAIAAERLPVLCQ